MIRDLKSINNKTKKLIEFLDNHSIQLDSENVSNVIQNFLELKNILGNLDMDIHFLAAHLANSFLKKEHQKSIDLSKPVGSSGLDVELPEIVGEIKTTRPYCEKDFGAKQKETIRKDLDRLENSDKKFKYFFVIDTKTEQILKEKYRKDYPSVKIVNLLKLY